MLEDRLLCVLGCLMLEDRLSARAGCRSILQATCRILHCTVACSICWWTYHASHILILDLQKINNESCMCAQNAAAATSLEQLRPCSSDVAALRSCARLTVSLQQLRRCDDAQRAGPTHKRSARTLGLHEPSPCIHGAGTAPVGVASEPSRDGPEQLTACGHP